MNAEAKSHKSTSTMSAQIEDIGSQANDDRRAWLALTKHAKGRMQQRGIKTRWIELVLEYGREVYQKGRQSYKISLDKIGIKKIQSIYGSFEDLRKLRSVYVIVAADDGAIVTCAYR